MVISHKHKFMFFHIPRTAGMSISDAVAPHLGENDETFLDLVDRPEQIDTPWRYSTPHSVRSWFSDQDYAVEWESYFKFTFIRNPFDIHVSMYNWWINDEHENKTWLQEKEQRVRNLSFNQYVKDTSLTWDKNLLDCTEGTNYAGKWESIHVDFPYVCGRIGLPQLWLDRKNASRPIKDRKDFMDEYDPKAESLVYQRHLNDLIHFDYLSNLRASSDVYYCSNEFCPGHSHRNHQCER